MLQRVNDVIEKALLNISMILLANFVIVVFAKVVSRNYLKLSMMWADEVSVFCFVWTIFLGAAVAVRQKKHFVVEIFPANYVRTNRALELLSYVATVAFILVMVIHGYKFFFQGLSRLSTTLGIPLAYWFAAIPVSGVAMLLFSVELFVQDLRNWAGGGKGIAGQ